MMHPNVLVIGGNLKNKGAEAMLITLFDSLKESFPTISFTVASYAKEQLQHNENGEVVVGERSFPIKFVRNKKTPAQFANLLMKNHKKDAFLQKLKNADCVIDVSGFGFSDKRSFLRRLMYCVEIYYSKKSKTPFIANSQAFGPFNKLSSKILGKIFLPKMNLMITRGVKSQKYVNSLLNTTSQHQHADIAYLFKKASDENVASIIEKNKINLEEKNIGIIPNINLYHRLGEEYIRSMANLGDYIQNQIGANAIFICHEFYENKYDDRKLIHDIVARMKTKESVCIIDSNYTAAQLKGLIGKMDFAVASRFHSAIAAISTQTPLLVIGWAHKYKELLEEAGLYNSLIDASNLKTDHLIKTMQLRWDQREKDKQIIETHLPLIQTSSQKGIDLIKDAIRRIMNTKHEKNQK